MKRIMAMILTLVLAATLLAGCKPEGEASDGVRGKIKLTFWAGVGEANAAQYKEAVDKFNDTHLNIKVSLIPQSADFAAELSGALRGSNPPGVVLIDDRYFKRYVKEGYLTKLDDQLTASSNTLKLDEIWPNLVDRFSYNPETGYSGQGKDYYAVPSGDIPSIIYYNSTQFKAQGINIISLPEEELDGYNAAKGAALLPHGYYVYDKAPVTGMTARGDGKYHVFNNRIPMNWEEMVALAKLFTKEYNPSSPSKCGYLTEWWFSFAWSVGGDCLEWDDAKNQYILQ